MIEKIVKKHALDDPDAKRRDLEHWLSKPPAERVAAVEFLRRMHHGDAPRLQRVARVVRRP